MKVKSAIVPVAAIVILMLITFLTPFTIIGEADAQARDITDKCRFSFGGNELDGALTDNNIYTFAEYPAAYIGVISPEPIGGVYIRFDRTPPEWTIAVGSEIIRCGSHGFLHEYIPVGDEDVRSLTLRFDDRVAMADIFILSRSEALPAFVQTWRSAGGPCDVMLLACHSDDDQLYFAGSVPDAVARGAEMQVCFFINHWDTHARPHELLDGLWACGLDRYPIIGPFPDVWLAHDEDGALRVFGEYGFTFDDMIAHQTELLRRFKPQVVLVHDINGEYGHTAHILDSHALRSAVAAAADPSQYHDSADKYGCWDVPKVYIHLYGENTIDFEIDAPLDAFGGKTAFAVSQEAFRCHITQQNTVYSAWLLGTSDAPITSSRSISSYSPRQYGLWRSLVGNDSIRSDFYEHIAFRSHSEPTTSPNPTGVPEDPTVIPTSVPAEQSPVPAAPGSGSEPLIVLAILLPLLALAALAIHLIIKYN